MQLHYTRGRRKSQHIFAKKIKKFQTQAAKTKGVHVVAVQFKDGKRSLLELDDTRFKAIKLAMF